MADFHSYHVFPNQRIEYETVQLENVHLCLSGHDFPSTDGVDEVNHMVRFYGGVFHNEVRFVGKGDDWITIPEIMPSFRGYLLDFLENEAGEVNIRSHHYRRLWLSLGDGWSKPFSVFVYEGWD